jgi:hypothetical protein
VQGRQEGKEFDPVSPPHATSLLEMAPEGQESLPPIGGCLRIGLLPCLLLTVRGVTLDMFYNKRE